MQMLKTDLFDGVLSSVPCGIANVLRRLPDSVKLKTDEIRLRAGLPVCLTVCGRPLFITRDSTVKDLPVAGCLTARAPDITECVRLICNNSVYAHTAEINNGYIAMPYGHRAGVAGNFSGDNAYEFSSVNIRLARQINGAADFLVTQPITGGVLIAGPPSSGKTTVLRDLIRQLSSGNGARRVTVVDTRGEISAFSGGEPALQIGENTDVLFGVDKPHGIEIALRSLNPQIIAFDEIGTAAELNGVKSILNGGAFILTTAHAGTPEDLLRRSVTAGLIKGGFVDTVAFLSGADYKDKKVYKAKELL